MQSFNQIAHSGDKRSGKNGMRRRRRRRKKKKKTLKPLVDRKL